MGVQESLAVLFVRAPQRKSEDYDLLAAFLQQQPFFAGVDLTVLQEICKVLSFHQAAPGEMILHAGELTDRMYLMLSGRCSVVRHSRKEGFQPKPPEPLLPGQALCEAALVVSGRRSDVFVTAEAESLAAAESDTGGSSGGGVVDVAGATFAVLSRAAWSNMCTRAPLEPVCGQARTALLCCCARSLAAASTPGQRTMEQADDLAAVLKQLPGLALTPDPVLRAMSESVVLHRLPAGSIVFEESTRAAAEFVVLGGTVQIRRRHRRLGARATTAAHKKARHVAAPAVADGGGKSVREKIEDERKAREALKESLALTRDGLRELKAPPPPPPIKSVDGSRRWMTEYVDRARKLNPGGRSSSGNGDEPPGEAGLALAAAAAGTGAAGPGGGPGPVPPGAPVVSSNGNMSRAAQMWRRAVLGVVPGNAHIQMRRSTPNGHGGGGGVDAAVLEEGADALLLEYARMKEEEAGHVTDVGKLLGGAGSREAYLRGILEARSRKGYGYGYGYEEDAVQEEELEQGSGGGGDEDQDGGEDVDGEDGDDAGPIDPLLRLSYLDRDFQLTSKIVRFEEAAEALARLVETRGWDARTGLGPEAAAAAEPTIQSIPFADVPAGVADDPAASAADAAAAVARRASRGGRRPSCGSLGGGSGLLTETLTEPADEHMVQLYGPDIGAVDAGHTVGELPEAALCRAAGLSGGAGGQLTTPLLRRADTAVAGPLGSDVLVVALEALRRGHEAARDDLVSERLAVLTALEPLRGLSDEHQAQLALACTVAALDANQLVVRQGQHVDALYVVLEGEVRLLDDPMEGLTTAAPAAAAAAAAAVGPGGNAAALAFASSGRSMSLNGSSFNRRAVAIAAAAAAATAAEAPAVGVGSSVNGRSATGLAGSGGGAAPSPPAGGASGGHAAIRVRRALAALPALSLLGPGGSFGESVLGYPEDAAAEAAAEAQAESADKDGVSAGGAGGIDADESSSSDSDEDGGGGFALGSSLHKAHRASGAVTGYGNGPPSSSSSSRRGERGNLSVASTYLASAVTARPSRLLVLPRSLLVKYGYLRISLPPFADLRRDALNGRRQQLKAGLQTLPGVALGLVPAPAPPATGPGGPGGPAALAAGGVGGRTMGRSPSMPPPRPPPPRPIEFLEQMGFKNLTNPRTAAILGSLSTGGVTGGSTGGSGSSTPDPRRAAAGTAAAASDAPSPDHPGTGGHSGSGGGGAPGAGGGKGAGAVSGLSVTSLVLAERLKRLGLTDSPDNTAKVGVGGGSTGGLSGTVRSSALSQFLESNEEDVAGGVDRRPSGAMEYGGSNDMDAGGGGGDAEPSATGDLHSVGSGGGGGSGYGDVLRAPPKPCVMRTSLTGFRQYGSGGVNGVVGPVGVGSLGILPKPAMRTSLSGLPLISSGSTGGAPNSSGGGTPFLSRRATFHHAPAFLRTDLISSSDDAAAAAAAALSPSPGSGADIGSPRSLRAAAHSLPAPISTAAAAEASSPTAAAHRGISIMLPQLGSAGSRPDSPGGGGGGGSSSPMAARMRTSFNGMPAPPGYGDARWDRSTREGVAAHSPPQPPLTGNQQHPQTFPQPQPQQRSQPQAPQLNMYPTNFTSALSAAQGYGSAAASPRSRLRGTTSSRTLTSLELAMGSYGAVDAAAAAAGAPPAQQQQQHLPAAGVRAFGATGAGSALLSGAGGAAGGRHAWKELPDVYSQMRSSWDGAGARAAGGGHVVSRGGTVAATALALATLAANTPQESQYLLVP